jgi:phosphate starvation-inducible PhoH-like protein
MGRKRANALRREAESFGRITNKETRILNNTFEERNSRSNVVSINPNNIRRSNKPINLVPKSINQETYILALQNPDTDVVVAHGPAGTGKTYLAVLAAIAALRNGETERIVMCRPAVSVEDEDHGFLPGDLNAKLAPWVRPITDILREYYGANELEYMVQEEIVEFAPLGFMRGRTFKNCYIILDESQNASPAQLKMLLTRIGNGSKIVITGDTEQADRRDPENGLMDLKERLISKPVSGIESCEFTMTDVQRHRLIGEIIKLYN